MPRAILLLLVVCTGTRSSHAAQRFIVENGQPRAEIVIAERPERTVRVAAQELQDYVQKISGAHLPIVTQPTGKAVKLFVGRSPGTEKLGITADGLKYGAYRLVSGDDWLVFLGDDTEFVPREPWPRNSTDNSSGKVQKQWEEMTGAPWGVPSVYYMWKDRDRLPATTGLPDAAPKPPKNALLEAWAYDERGSFNAVNALLRDLGVRWLLPGPLGEFVPSMATIPLPKIDRTVHPDFELRQFSLHGPTETKMWMMRLGTRYGYGMVLEHGMTKMTRRQEIFDAHPDWFAMYGGRRPFDPHETNNHLCFSNEELFQETVRYARKVFDVYDFECVSVMPADAYTAICQCPLCAGKDQPELGARGHLSNHVWDFVNRVAKEVGKTHPHKLIACSAYGSYHLPPTNIDKLEPNVQVEIVGGRRPKSGVTQQGELRALRESWLKKTDRPILIYENYPLTGRGWYQPTFMARTIGQSINETKGVSRGEDIHLNTLDASSKNFGFDSFGVYFTARMYWGGKQQDPGALLEEYCRLMYGPAGEAMREFFDYCEVNWPDMEQDKTKVDAALALFEAAKAKLDTSSLEARRLALIDAFLNGLRHKSTQLAQKRGAVPKLRLTGDAAGIVVDGKLDEPFWQDWRSSAVGRLREVQTGAIPTFDTSVKVGWEGSHLYFGVRCAEIPGQQPNITATKNGDHAIFYGDAVEFLIETDSHSYYQIVVNPAGAIVDLDRGVDKGSWDTWESKADVATQVGDGFWTIEIRIPVTEDENDPLHLVVGRKPSTSLPWHVNICRQRIRDKGTELSAFSPTGASGFHHPLRFAYLHSGLSHTFEADPSVTTFMSAAQAASKLPKEQAIAAYVALAEGSQGKPTELQQSYALKQAAAAARALKDLDRAEQLAARIPIEAERNTAEMLNLLSQRKPQEVIARFGNADLEAWPFTTVGEAYLARGRAYAAVGEKQKAVADLQAALPWIGDPRLRSDAEQALKKAAEEL
ncbi:MAG TPA: DUF4838 domain-containing protein [Pirellulales bacterium]|nr:DUF4838 domain-containing protein [Pirellulales bacterium]